VGEVAVGLGRDHGGIGRADRQDLHVFALSEAKLAFVGVDVDLLTE
jgi:hypothetical protein